MKIDILSLTLEQLINHLNGQPKYRAKQVFGWLHKRQVSGFDEMTDISLQLREKLSEEFFIKQLKAQKTLMSARKDTVKYLYELDDGNKIETVLMLHRHGNSLCISSQVGCKMACAFCASGLAGFVRNLTPSEMLLQLYETLRLNHSLLSTGNRQLSIVIMGVGEPLDNFDNVMGFLQILQSPDGYKMSLRHVSLSTCGLVDKIDELAKLNLGLTLSISLHAVTDEERSKIMPVNRKFNLERLLACCKEYFNTTKRRISFEYALISGINDSENHGKHLAKLLSVMPKGSYHVNLIPVNEVNETPFQKSNNAKEFAVVLEKAGVTTTIRRTMGSDIAAACGQLRNRSEICL